MGIRGNNVMAKIKLADWAKQNGLSYITANRLFHNGSIPNSQQLDSGTILVEDSSALEQTMANNTSNDAMTLFLKKTVEFSKNDSTVEDFAAYVISNFTLKLNGATESPKYSRNKPKADEVQKHFQNFLKPKGEKPKPNMFIASEETLEEIAQAESHSSYQPTDMSAIPVINASDIPELNQSLLELFVSPSAEGTVSQSVDLTPQHFNYTGSNNVAFSSNSFSSTIDGANVSPHQYGSFVFNSQPTEISHNASVWGGAPSTTVNSSYQVSSAAGTFGPTRNELTSANQGMDIVEKSRRGRKPSKITRKPE
jgi:hypothetical protein